MCYGKENISQLNNKNGWDQSFLAPLLSLEAVAILEHKRYSVSQTGCRFANKVVLFNSGYLNQSRASVQEFQAGRNHMC